ncbi:acyl carrier protein [Streptomyces canus]|uniref:acyl carrier protein n=1 Tax=Streptomyces canus TaxID=58343 RepID=UPI0030E53965
MDESNCAGDGMLAAIRTAIKAHLGVDLSDVPPEATIGLELGLDSLDVFAVMERTGALLGCQVGFDYNDPATVTRLGSVDQLTVAAFAECLTCR